MEFYALVDVLANVGSVFLVSIALLATGLFFFDSRAARRTPVLTLVQRERRAA